MKALSFLGTGNYQPTTYTWNGASCRTRFMPVALRDLFAPEELKVAVTPGATDKHGDDLAEACDYTPVAVPGASGEAAWWKMFNALTDAVEPGERLLVDVTHGYRSQPFLALAVILYLRAVKDVTIERIVYGAFESGTDEESPVVDLTAFLTLIDWARATRQFQDYGDADALKDMFVDMADETRLGDQVALNLRPAGQTLKKASRALALNRPIETLHTAAGFVGEMEAAMDDAMSIPQARPVKRLMLQIAERFSPIGHAEGSVFTSRGFTAQAAMLRLYLDTEQYLQAFTLGQEMLVSWVCIQHDLDPRARGVKADEDQEPKGRAGARSMLHHWTDNEETWAGEPITDLEATVTRLWTRLRTKRNDVAHAGFSYNPMPADDLIEEADELLAEVAAFFE